MSTEFPVTVEQVNEFRAIARYHGWTEPRIEAAIDGGCETYTAALYDLLSTCTYLLSKQL